MFFFLFLVPISYVLDKALLDSHNIGTIHYINAVGMETKLNIISISYS